ncbi:hypothetical protein GQR58_007051 [Nymphon striatum]|nr:hypothetical protein GQR58_007051 [Nymphon striatum]
MKEDFGKKYCVHMVPVYLRNNVRFSATGKNSVLFLKFQSFQMMSAIDFIRNDEHKVVQIWLIIMAQHFRQTDVIMNVKTTLLTNEIFWHMITCRPEKISEIVVELPVDSRAVFIVAWNFILWRPRARFPTNLPCSARHSNFSFLMQCPRKEAFKRCINCFTAASTNASKSEDGRLSIPTVKECTKRSPTGVVRNCSSTVGTRASSLLERVPLQTSDKFPRDCSSHSEIGRGSCQSFVSSNL